jgi:hypothetical protein
LASLLFMEPQRFITGFTRAHHLTD